jgi:HNH endonuclease
VRLSVSTPSFSPRSAARLMVDSSLPVAAASTFENRSALPVGVIRMKCIFCLEEKQTSLEHVFPLAIGGRITTERVCKDCNSLLGSRVDSGLSNNIAIRQRRAQLGLPGNSGEIPNQFEMLLGVGNLVGQGGKRIRTKFDAASGQFKNELLHHVNETIAADGSLSREITIDASKIGDLPKIIRREFKRRGLPAPKQTRIDELVRQASQNLSSIEHPLVQIPIKVDLRYLGHAMLKIAYELAFLWLGDDYLNDDLARGLRKAILSEDIVFGSVVKAQDIDAKSHSLLSSWIPHTAHHLAYMIQSQNNLVIVLRVFDIYGLAVIISERATRYNSCGDDPHLRFLVIDSVSGRTHETSWFEEIQRLARAMSESQRFPPFPDPLE